MRSRARRSPASVLAVVGGIAAVVAAVTRPAAARAAFDQTWPAFALVTGLLLVGVVAADDGLFESVGAWLGDLPGGGVVLYIGSMIVVAGVTAVLNLDTAVVFLTPVLIHASRRRSLDEAAFVYGTVLMCNAASLLLPGSNLTNLLVLRSHPENGGAFAVQMLPAWLTACGITVVFVIVAFRPTEAAARTPAQLPPIRLGFGAAAIVAAAGLVVLLPNPAVPVLAVGIAAAAGQRRPPRLDARLLALLFAGTVSLGTLARLWSGPARLLDSSGIWGATGIGAAASLVVNNLPATVLLTARAPAHPEALLLGLDIGPNLFVTGSLSAVLWLQAARGVGARPSIATYLRLGMVLVPVTLAATLAVQALVRS